MPRYSPVVTIRGRTFQSLEAAAEHFNVTVQTVSRHRKKGTLDMVGVSKAGRKKGTKNTVRAPESVWTPSFLQSLRNRFERLIGYVA